MSFGKIVEGMVGVFVGGIFVVWFCFIYFVFWFIGEVVEIFIFVILIYGFVVIVVGMFGDLVELLIKCDMK